MNLQLRTVGPAELLRSFGFEVFFPENHGALLGATRTAMDFIPEAIKCGYSGHICSYTTADIGSYLKKQSPLQKHYGMEGQARTAEIRLASVIALTLFIYPCLDVQHK